MRMLPRILALLALAAGCGGGGASPSGDAGNDTRDSASEGDVTADAPEGAMESPPGPGELGAACTTDADCTNVVGQAGVCYGFGATGMGCTIACTTDADCGPEGLCANWVRAGFPDQGQKCVRRCTTSAACALGTTCVCDTMGGQSGMWCSIWPPIC